MTQYTEKVRTHGMLMEAQKWAMNVKIIHVHGLSSMWYDDRPQDTMDGKKVTDVEYNCGIIKRYQGEDLIHQWGKMPNDTALLNMMDSNAAH